MPSDWKARARRIEAPTPVAPEAPIEAPEAAPAAPAGGSWRDRARRIEEPPGLGESALRGAAQGATLGFADEAQAAARTAPSVLKPLGEGLLRANAELAKQATGGAVDLTGQVPEQEPLPSLSEVGETYRGFRDPYRARDEAAAAANPVPFYGSQLIAGAAVPLGAAGLAGRGAAAGASLGARALAGAAAAAPMGAIAGLGSSKADLTRGEFGKAALDTAIGAGTSAAVGAAVPVVAEGARAVGRGISNATQGLQQRAAPALREWAGGQLAKAAGLYGRHQVRQVGDANDARELGHWAADEGLVTFGSSLETVAKRAAQKNTDAGQVIDQIRSQAQAQGQGPDSATILGQIEGLVSGYRKYANPIAKKLAETVDAFKDDIAANADPQTGIVPPRVLDDLKEQLDDVLYAGFSDQAGRLSRGAKAIQVQMRRIFKESEEGVVDQLGPDIGAAFRKAKQDYGNSIDVLRWLRYSDEGKLANLGLGLRETGLVIAGLGEPASAGLAFAGKRLADRYGNSIAGLAARRLAGPAAAQAPAAVGAAQPAAGQILQLPPRVSQILQSATGKGPQAAAAAAMVLIQQNPELRDGIIDYVRGFGSGPEPIPALR